MEDLLYLVHRIPWPPNKGDKIRSHNILRYLAQHYRVHLGTFIDDPADSAYLPELEAICASVCARPLPRRRAQLRALTGLLTGEPLSLPWYRDRVLQRWVRQTLQEHSIRRALAFSSAMAQYLPADGDMTRVIDFVDVDSDKWTQYADTKTWPMSAIYRREGRRLLASERRLAAASHASLFVSPEEAAAFREWAPESAHRVHSMNNGVNQAYFDPARIPPETPYPANSRVLVFTGAMDYWPNVDAVDWFAREVFPRVRAREPRALFSIVGSRPTPVVTALGELPGVSVTGFVEDVRQWIGHADVAVAPLRIARGVQNKVLEAMALARPVVATPQALDGLTVRRETEVIESQAEAEVFARAVTSALAGVDPGLGARARQRVECDYDWSRNLADLTSYLGAPASADKPGVAAGAERI